MRVPDGAREPEVEEGVNPEATAAPGLVCDGHLVRLWNLTTTLGENKAVGLYHAATEPELDGLLGALLLNDRMQKKKKKKKTTLTPLEPHPNDRARTQAAPFRLPDPRLTRYTGSRPRCASCLISATRPEVTVGSCP